MIRHRSREQSPMLHPAVYPPSICAKCEYFSLINNSINTCIYMFSYLHKLLAGFIHRRCIRELSDFIFAIHFIKKYGNIIYESKLYMMYTL